MQSQYPCKREAQRGVTHRVKRRKQWDKAEMRVVWPQAEKYQQPPRREGCPTSVSAQ